MPTSKKSTSHTQLPSNAMATEFLLKHWELKLWQIPGNTN